MDTEQLLERATNSPNNLRFEDLVSLVQAFGFRLRRRAAAIRCSRDREFLSL
jgi:hypothetical protein